MPKRFFLSIFVSLRKQPVLYSRWVDKISLDLASPGRQMNHWVKSDTDSANHAGAKSGDV
jgi:hypothetical protein